MADIINLTEVRDKRAAKRRAERDEAIKRHPASSLPFDGGGKESMNIFETTPSYEEWCSNNGLDPNNDENYNSYCEWKANS